LTEPTYPEKLKRAARLLLFKRGRKPGMKEWELKAALGKRYLEVLKDLNELLKELDLEVYGFEEVEESSKLEGVEGGRRFLVRLKGTMPIKEAKLLGWRIDNLAALAFTLGMLVSRQGKAERVEVERALGEKLGRWRSMTLVDSMMRNGYIAEEEDGMLCLGWRTKAEVDLKALMTSLILTAPTQDSGEQTR
jgi:hypothetical protein